MSDYEYLLEVPLDASQVWELNHDHPVKVVAYTKRGETHERIVKLDADGKGHASFGFREAPGSVQVYMGPEKASSADLKNFQTLSVNVPASSWRESRVELPAVQISSYYWRWWLHWCRSFKVTGRLQCANGSPVAGATVTAIDVEAWWWWTSQDVVGSAVTDSNGTFEIDFTRCCGWWPWFWWERRYWLVDPYLVKRIHEVVSQDPKLGRLPAAIPAPSLDVFQPLLASKSKTTRNGRIAEVGRPTAKLSGAIDAEALNSLRERLIDVLPREFPYPIWPWYPWYPWWDCDANLIFKATQTCSGKTNVVIAETIADTRWDISNAYNVTLTANELACCAYGCSGGGDQCPQGNCFVPSDLCGVNVGSVGGNVGAPPCTPAQVGLVAPGVGDRPFGGNVSLVGTFGDLVNVDYYEVQYATSQAGPYSPLPLPAAGGFDRQVLTVAPGPVFSWVPVAFPVTPIGDGTITHNVIETIAHYESVNGSQIWDAGSHDLLLVLETLNTLPNGTYYLQLVGYVRPGTAGNLALADTGNPGSPGILPICDPNAADPLVNNWWVVTLDNQAPLPTDPSGQPCGLHTCTDQPTSAFLQLAILHNDGTNTIIEGCQNIAINCTDQLQVDFAAYDPDGFLDYFTLETLYGVDLSVDLLSVSPQSLVPSPLAPAWAPAATQVGTSYAAALSQGATSPVWSGGSLRLTLSALAAFPVTCAYLLQLNVYKRTIVNCDGADPQNNVSFESFTIQVNCPPAP